ncbi:MAG: hypothetical protein AMXMBFR83_15600 [Phycisphaerae bacterium]
MEAVVLWKICACVTAMLVMLVGACAPAANARIGGDAPLREFAISQCDPLPRARGGHSAERVDGQLLVMGGTDWSADRTRKTWLDDSVVFSGGAWREGPRLPAPVAHAVSCADGGSIYLAGGTDGTRHFKDVYCLSDLASSGRWQRVAGLPMGLSAAGGAVWNRAFFVACGETDQGLSNRMWRLDLARPQRPWQPCDPLPGAARAFPAMLECGGSIYLLGGVAGWEPLAPLKDAYRYDPRTDRWSRLPDLPWAGYAWSAAPVGRDHALLAGQADGEVHSDLWLLDLTSMTARKIGDAAIQTTTAPLVNVRPGEWWLIGGEPDSKKTRTNRITVIRAAG